MVPIDAPEAVWPWYLLFATMAFAAGAIGLVAYKSLVPVRASAATVKPVVAFVASSPRP